MEKNCNIEFVMAFCPILSEIQDLIVNYQVQFLIPFLLCIKAVVVSYFISELKAECSYSKQFD